MSIRKTPHGEQLQDRTTLSGTFAFDVMWRGKRFRLPVNEYAIPRMESGKQHPIQSMEEARDWERRPAGLRSIGSVRSQIGMLKEIGVNGYQYTSPVSFARA